ncbi:MAG: hypothetical protein JO227_23800 [Acetobacteraceae bacterium]|nr:hypothetical protein [Acetobacteraceae bacterium]
MKTAITLRLDTHVLEAARQEAARDSRTLTNFIEVVLKQRLRRSIEDNGYVPGKPGISEPAARSTTQ